MYVCATASVLCVSSSTVLYNSKVGRPMLCFLRTNKWRWRFTSNEHLSDLRPIVHISLHKKPQLSLTNPRDAKACQKLLQFDVLTTLSLTILAYLHSFSCCCIRNLRNPAKFTEKFKLMEFKVIQGHRSWCQSKAHVRLPISH